MSVQNLHATTPDEPRPATLVEAGGEGLALAQAATRHLGHDLIVTLPGAELPFEWQERLRKAAYAAPRIAAAIPMCDAVSFAALVDENLREAVRAQAAQVDRTAYVMGNRSYYEAPRLHPVCVYLRRDALDFALGALPPGLTDPQQVLDALAKHWTATGWNCVLCDYLYVGFPRALPATPSFDEIAYGLHHPLGALRRSVNDAIRGAMPPVSVPGLDTRPVQLHVMHFWGGGLDRWVRDFGRADTAAINMILASFRIGEQGGQRLVLYSDPAALVPVRTWDIARPIRSTASGSLEYRRILEQVVREFEVESIIVSSLIGHALDALDMPVRTVVVCHDYYPVCQAINPMFGKTCERCTLEDLRRCGASNPLNSIFKDQSSEDWHAMRNLFVERVVARRIEVAVPSPSVAATLQRLEPRLRDHPVHVSAHGMDFAAAPLPPAPRAARERLRLVVLGRLSLQKGSELLQAAARELEPLAEVTILGGGKNGVRLAEACGWKSVERYELGELPGLLQSLAPHAGVLASVIPETFSFTLSELQALAIPPLATALGSFSDRVVEGDTGFLFEPDARALVALVTRLHRDPALLERVSLNLAARPAQRSTVDMVRDYRALLPANPRPTARFQVGIGTHTALTEPYRHLSEAYAQLAAAYAQTQEAYIQMSTAYGTTRAELDRRRAVWSGWRQEFEALRVSTQWWRLPEAMQLVKDLPKRMRTPEGDSAK